MLIFGGVLRFTRKAKSRRLMVKWTRLIQVKQIRERLLSTTGLTWGVERPPPCDYNRIFSSARGKPLLWQMMEETLKRVIQKRANGQIFIIESSSGRW